MNERELREFREKLSIPISDEKVVDAPFYRPVKSSKEIKYITECRKKLGGFLPERKVSEEELEFPEISEFKEFLKAPKSELSTTMAFVHLSKLLRDKRIGERIVPIIPDEARTFGMNRFTQYGIYSHLGQLYEPVDFETIIYYRESKDGQILEDINESGSMCSFIASGTSYATY